MVELPGSPSLRTLSGLHALIKPLKTVEQSLGVGVDCDSDYLTPRGETPITKGGAMAKAAFFEQFAELATMRAESGI